MLVELSSITFAKEKFGELLIVSLVKTSTELPTVLNDCTVLPGEMTITGISAANILFAGNINFETGWEYTQTTLQSFYIIETVNIDGEEAEGYAVERVNNAMGDASLYESILVEYAKNPQITKDRLYIEMMETVLGNNKNKIIVDKDIENLVPFLNQKLNGIK